MQNPNLKRRVLNWPEHGQFREEHGVESFLVGVRELLDGGKPMSYIQQLSVRRKHLGCEGQGG